MNIETGFFSDCNGLGVLEAEIGMYDKEGEGEIQDTDEEHHVERASDEVVVFIYGRPCQKTRRS